MRIRPSTAILWLAIAGCTQPNQGARPRDSGSAGEGGEGGTGGGVGGSGGGGGGSTGGSAGATTGGSGPGAGSGGAGQGGTAGTAGADAAADVGPSPMCTGNAGCGPCQECVSGACRNQAAGQ